MAGLKTAELIGIHDRCIGKAEVLVAQSMDGARHYSRNSSDVAERLANVHGNHALVHQAPRLPRGPNPMISLPTSTTTRSQPTSNNFIALDRMRTGHRATNDYVNPPLPLRGNKNNNGPVESSSGDLFSGPGRPITTQPSSDFKKNPAIVPITCEKCNLCTCGKCTQPRPLPSRWLCNETCLCSAEKVVDVVTCMWIPKGCLYHFCKDKELDNEVDAAVNPCAGCSERHCCQRWACLLTTFLFCPLLACNPLLKCSVKACTCCYNSTHRHGCHCRDSSKHLATRGLLESESSST